jgi:hypothetical protein
MSWHHKGDWLYAFSGQLQLQFVSLVIHLVHCIWTNILGGELSLFLAFFLLLVCYSITQHQGAIETNLFMDLHKSGLRADPAAPQRAASPVGQRPESPVARHSYPPSGGFLQALLFT